jgi:hypothetical protein
MAIYSPTVDAFNKLRGSNSTERTFGGRVQSDPVLGDKSRWFDVDEENIRNIQRRGYYGKDGIDIGYKAAYCDDGFEVITQEDFNRAYNKLEPNDMEQDGFERF